MKQLVSLWVLPLALVVAHCGDSSGDGAADCPPDTGGLDCFEPCSTKATGPVCKDGKWVCDQPATCDSGNTDGEVDAAAD